MPVDDTMKAPARPVYVVRPAFDQIHQLYDGKGALLNGSELRWTARAINAFEPMRDVLLAVEWQGGNEGGRCPYCYALKNDEHNGGCALAFALTHSGRGE